MSSPKAKRKPPQTPSWRVPIICAALATITFVVFGQTLGHKFINYDDDVYIYSNPVVKQGLTLKGFLWAWTFGGIGHWHPLTWLSHMADCQIFGLWAGGHHLTSVILHTAAAVFLFLALINLAGGVWRSAFVAALFAIHPLHVESVAWVAERKDVLSGLFFMLTLWSYARYAKQPSRKGYVVVVVAYGLGLLCKNMLVTLPLILLLLDWWPLQRISFGGSGTEPTALPFGKLLREKIPLFLLAIGSCVATFLVPERVMEPHHIPFFERLISALDTCVIYIGQIFVPLGLAIPYPNPPNGLPVWTGLLALLLLVAISAMAFAWRERHPCLLVGWLWYLIMLAPTVGIIQISYYALHADRYTYLPAIGIFLAVTWFVDELGAGWKNRQALAYGAVGIIGALAVCAFIQTAYWKNSETLWTHSLAVTRDNYIACNDLGRALRDEGRTDEAVADYQRALQINPNYPEALNNLGCVLQQQGMMNEAINDFQRAVEIRPDYPKVHYNLAAALAQQGRLDEAISHYQSALKLEPDDFSSEMNLGSAFLQKGNVDEAIHHYQNALPLDSENAWLAHLNLGIAYMRKGSDAEAISHLQTATELRPNDVTTQINLASLLSTSADKSLRNGRKALDLAQQANRQTGGSDPTVLRILAAALAETGRQGEALQAMQGAIELARRQGQTNMIESFDADLKRMKSQTMTPP